MLSLGASLDPFAAPEGCMCAQGQPGARPEPAVVAKVVAAMVAVTRLKAAATTPLRMAERHPQPIYRRWMESDLALMLRSRNDDHYLAGVGINVAGNDRLAATFER